MALFSKIQLRYFLILLILAANVPLSLSVGEHKRILYEKTVGRYAVESKVRILGINLTFTSKMSTELIHFPMYTFN